MGCGGRLRLLWCSREFGPYIRLGVYTVCERTITQLPDMAEAENIRNPVANSLNINDGIEVIPEV